MSEQKLDPSSEQTDIPTRLVSNIGAKYDVFVSYSRKDEPFAEAIEEALRKSDKTVWRDRKDIRPTEEWIEAIYAGIEAADNFLFVISPDSLVSDVCSLELAHA